jgi:hypothetical protein
MMKKHIRLVVFFLAITGSLFFADVVYSSEGGVIVGQPQLDTPAIVGSGDMANAAAVNTPAVGGAQPSASSPAPVNTKKVDRDFFRGDVATPR